MRSPAHTSRFAVVLILLLWSGSAFGGEIHDTANKGDLEKVEALLKANPSLVSSKDDQAGDTPLPIVSPLVVGLASPPPAPAINPHKYSAPSIQIFPRCYRRKHESFSPLHVRPRSSIPAAFAPACRAEAWRRRVRLCVRFLSPQNSRFSFVKTYACLRPL